MTMKELRLYVFNRAGWICAVCGSKIDWSTGQLAHRIPKTKRNIKQYGLLVIDHPFNVRAICSLRCNAAVLIDNRPIEKQQLIEAIKRTVKNPCSENTTNTMS